MNVCVYVEVCVWVCVRACGYVFVCVCVTAVGDTDKATDGVGLPICPPQIPHRLSPSVRDETPTTKSLHHVTVHV
jgi:hypothetical protein